MLSPINFCLLSPVQHDHQDDPVTPPSSKRRKKGRKNKAASSKTPPTTISDATTTEDSATHLGRSLNPSTTGTHRHDGAKGGHATSVGASAGVPMSAVGGSQEGQIAPGQLAIDVIPTSSSKRCHAANVALRGTVDIEVTRLKELLTATERREGCVEKAAGLSPETSIGTSEVIRELHRTSGAQPATSRCGRRLRLVPKLFTTLLNTATDAHTREKSQSSGFTSLGFKRQQMAAGRCGGSRKLAAVVVDRGEA